MAINFAQYQGPGSTDKIPTVTEVLDATGDLGHDWPGVLGRGTSHASQPTHADPGAPFGQSGNLGWDPYYAGHHPYEQLVENSAGRFPNPEYGGEPSRLNRLARDPVGPATSTTVESFRIDGQSGGVVAPRRGDIAHSGPVGASDLGQYLVNALAQSGYDVPSAELSQLNMALGI